MVDGPRVDKHGMEARETSQPAHAITWRAKLIPLQGSAPDTDIEVSHMASRLMTAKCGCRLRPGLPVRIDQHDAILLGEIAACREETPGEFSLLIEMNESLSGLHSIRRLVGALLGEAREGEPVHPMGSMPRRLLNLGRRQSAR